MKKWHLKKPREIIKNESGETMVDSAVMIAVVVTLLMLIMQVAPVFMTKQKLDTFANELIRTAEMSGRVGMETDSKTAALSGRLNITPDIVWSNTGEFSIGDEINLTLTYDVDLGFGGFGSFPVKLRSEAVGTSEVYAK